MPPQTRRARRLQICDVDELASDHDRTTQSRSSATRTESIRHVKKRGPGRPRKTQTIEQAAPTSQSLGPPPKKRGPGRPRKQRGPGRPRKHQGPGRPTSNQPRVSSLARSKSLGPPDKDYKFADNDRWIADQIGWKMRKLTMGKRVGQAARSVLAKTKQWPWEWLTGVTPRKWSIPIIEDLRRLCLVVAKRATTHDYGHNFLAVKNFLHDRAKERDQNDPHLKHKDIKETIAHFSISYNIRREVSRPATATRIMPFTSLVDSDDDDDGKEGEGGMVDEELTDSGGFNPDSQQEYGPKQEEVAAEFRKRSRPLSSFSQVQKRARVAEAYALHNTNNSSGDFDSSPNAPESQNATNSTHRLHSFKDLVESFDLLVRKKEIELGATSQSLREVTASVLATETSIADLTNMGFTSGHLEQLHLDKKKHEATRESIRKEMQTFEQHCGNFTHLGPGIIAQMQQHGISKINDVDQLITQTNAKIQDEIHMFIRKNVALKERLEGEKEEKRRLQKREEEVLEEVKAHRFKERVMKLNLSAVAVLVAQLEAKSISLDKLEESVAVESAIAETTAPEVAVIQAAESATEPAASCSGC